MNPAPDSHRPQSPVPSECRAFLREAMLDPRADAPALGPHAAACSSCARRLAATRSLVAALSRRPVMPVDLASPQVLDAVYDRIVQQSEASKLGQLLDQGMPVPVSVGEPDAWPVPLQGTQLGRAVVVPPTVGTSEPVWADVRASILGAVAADSARLAKRHWVLGIAGAAAAVILFSLLVSEGTRGAPEIVFRDLDSVPNVDFAVLRYGEPR